MVNKLSVRITIYHSKANQFMTYNHCIMNSLYYFIVYSNHAMLRLSGCLCISN